MRSGIIIAIVAAVGVVIGGVVWYNNSEQARLEEQRTEQAAQAARDEQLAREQEEAAALEQSAREAEEAEALAARESAVEEDEAAVRDEGAIVIGDEITEDTIVVESATTEPVILDPDETTSTAEIIDSAEAVDSASTLETGSVEVGGGTRTTGEDGAAADATAETATAATTSTEPEELLTPANFDRNEVLALIDNSEQLTVEQRSTLRAVVEGASANPVMVEAAIESIRAAFDLPSLN